MRSLVVLDLETTGTWIEKDKIIEIGMVKINPDNTKETFIEKINPGISIPNEVTELTGISNEDVKGAPVFKEIAKKVLNFIGDSDIGGFSVEKFDLPILKREMNEAGFDLELSNRTIIDSKNIYHANEKRDLTAAYKFYCKKEIKDAHTALADASATLEVLVEQIKLYGDGSEGISSLTKFSQPKLTIFVDPERKLRFWNGDYYLAFGKYRNQSLKEIMKTDKRYLSWLLGTDMNEIAKSIISQEVNKTK